MDKSVFTDKIIELSPDSKIYVDAPMSDFTSFKIGGPADLVICPEYIETIIKIAAFCRTNRVPFQVIGNGTNLLVSDSGVRGVVIKLGGQINQMRKDNNKITAGAGTMLRDVVLFACENNLSGLEFLFGIPGTVGGAVVMNAGAYGREMQDVVIRTVYLDNKGNIGALDKESQGFGYRKSCFQDSKSIVLEVEFELESGDEKAIRSQMEVNLQKRRDSQPLEMPSAGSVFKRPEGKYAGQLIEECGLKGCQIGGAKVSEKHAGFIVNTGGATAKDVQRLISHIKRQVKKNFSVSLETEIKQIGDHERNR